ncbi:MAG: metallophosphoesterase [Anaerolineae bacterium]|nr:metallophosphoesterase [Anaerolineae bacterium]MDQ7033933.1 metallophosphoesterase [Anaerolineae bacterium]
MSKRLLTFVHISDTHIHLDPDYVSEHINFSSRIPVQKLIEAVNALPMAIDFVMHTGDVAHYPETAEHYHVAREILQQIRYPVYYCPGNHDFVPQFQEHFLGKSSDEIRIRYDTEFECNGVQIVMMDSHIPPDIEGHSGYLMAQQLDWLDEICRADDNRPLVVGIHHHPLLLEAPWLDRISLKNGIALHNTLLKAKHRLRGVFYGHIHENVITVREGISYYSAVSGWFQTQTWYAAEEPAAGVMQGPGFNLVTLTETDTFVRPVRIPSA